MFNVVPITVTDVDSRSEPSTDPAIITVEFVIGVSFPLASVTTIDPSSFVETTIGTPFPTNVGPPNKSFFSNNTVSFLTVNTVTGADSDNDPHT